LGRRKQKKFQSPNGKLLEPKDHNGGKQGGKFTQGGKSRTKRKEGAKDQPTQTFDRKGKIDWKMKLEKGGGKKGRPVPTVDAKDRFERIKPDFR